ncbi:MULTISPECIES: hypothetical protein [unclassified Streptomyces]|uniref:hypothetical protein n=1 Tax=unclassified Streptomyces TaxID=2593676 RepID=UPI0030785273
MSTPLVGDDQAVDREAMARCIEERFACVQACTACADACLSEGMVGDLAKCIRAGMDCADPCAGHADMHEHCWVCAEACRRC